MKYLVAALLLLSVQSLFGQSLVQSSERKYSSPVFQQGAPSVSGGKYATDVPGLRMRNTGRTLTILGAALFTGGVIVVSGAEETYYNTGTGPNGNYEEGDAQGAVGVLMIAGGAGMMVPGIIFWTKGSKKYKSSLQNEGTASVQLRPNGCAIRYRF